MGKKFAAYRQLGRAGSIWFIYRFTSIVTLSQRLYNRPFEAVVLGFDPCRDGLLKRQRDKQQVVDAK